MDESVTPAEMPVTDGQQQEPQRGGTPSSHRTTPSTAVVWAFEELKRHGFPVRTALDIGCGKGRNSLYLAQNGVHVTCMDFTPNALEHLQIAAQAEGLADKIRTVNADVTEAWPVAQSSMDFIIDAFCFKHIVSGATRQCYRDQLLRSLRVRGHYLISFGSVGDGYYGKYALEQSADGEEILVVDPSNGVQSVLYSPQKILQFFGPDLILCKKLPNRQAESPDEFSSNNPYAMLLQRNPHMI